MPVGTTVQVVMPEMGESVTEGVVLEWHKHEGDAINADETLVEISTDKVDAEVPSPTTGTVVALLVAEGDTVQVGTVLAEVSTNGGGATPDGAVSEAPLTPPAAGNGSSGEDASAHGSAANGSGASPSSAPSPTAPAPGGDAIGGASPGSAATPGTSATRLEITMPAMGESVTEGTVLEWHKAEGDQVGADETIVEISTDKVDAEVPAPAAGILDEVLVSAGDTVTVGQTLARMTTTAASPGAGLPTGGPATAATTSPPPTGASSPPTGEALSGSGADVGATPVARRAATVHGVDLSTLSGSGRAGRITKSDVLGAVDAKDANGAGAATAARRGVEESVGSTPLRGGAAALARYMDQSRSIPTATSFRTLTVTALDARRRELKAAGHRVSFTHLIAYAIARAATDMPVMTHHFAEIEGRPHRLDDGAVNLGLAVDVEKRDGTRTLMVPVIPGAGTMAFADFLGAYDALVEKARTNALTADDLSGANVSLTNPGGIGTVASVPRLMVGQGTIVATGSIAYPVGLGAIGDMIGAEKVMTMTSTYDHRVIQGAESGRFLERLDAYLHGERGFYDGVFASPPPGRRPPPPAKPRRPWPTVPPTSSCCRRCRPRPRCSRPTGPTATWRPAWTPWAPSPRVTRRSIPSP